MFDEQFYSYYKKTHWKLVPSDSSLYRAFTGIKAVLIFSPDGKASWPRMVMQIREFDGLYSFSIDTKLKPGTWWTNQRDILPEMVPYVQQMWQKIVAEST